MFKQSRTTWTTLGCLLAAGLLLGTVKSLAKPPGGKGGGGGITYTVVDLGTLGGDEAAAYDINDSGQVVGSSTTATGEDRAFLWDLGVMIDLGTLGGDYSHALAINNLGDIVGISHNASGSPRACVWVGADAFDLGTLGGNFSGAMGINNHGMVVGHARLPADPDGTPGQYRAFLVIPDFADSDNDGNPWFADTGDGLTNSLMINLGAFAVDPTLANSRHSGAEGINDAGWIVGDSMAFMPDRNENRKNAFVVVPRDTDGDGTGDLWLADDNGDGLNDLMTNLGTVGRLSSTARAINEDGQIVGRSVEPLFDSHPIVWEVLVDVNSEVTDVTATDLGIPKSFEGAWLEDINDASEDSPAQAVGFAKKKSAGYTNYTKIQDREPYLWQNGKMIALEGAVSDMGGFGDLDAAEGVNNSGTIIGNERGATIYDPVRAWIAVPNP